MKIIYDHPGPMLQWHTPRDFAFGRATLPMGELPPAMDGLRVLHLSDLHAGPRWAAGYDRLTARLLSDPPDLILFTGDFVENRHDHRVGLPTVFRLLPGLKSKHGLYAIFGNHDPDVMLPYLAEAGVHFVTHRRALVETSRGQVELIGFPGPSRRDFDPEFPATLPPRTPGVPRIVLSHYPDLFPRAASLDPDLYLAGHTHGGQVCLPNSWPPLTHDRMPRKLSKGIHRLGRTWYAVSRGFGFTGVPLRVFCPAEVVEFTFTSTPP